MPSGCLKGQSIIVIHPIDSYDASWSKDKLNNWIQKAGGRLLTKFTTNTTHIVCTERARKNRSGDIRTAIEARKRGERVSIVGPDWLKDTLFDGPQGEGERV